MHSPITGQPMREIDYEGMTIYTCDQTGGELVTADALAHIVNLRQETFSSELLSEIELNEPTFGIVESARGRELACPVCGTPMDVINYAGDTNVIIDRCSDCGAVWLDHNELEHIQAVLERWEDDAPSAIDSVQQELNAARQRNNEKINSAFAGSRFTFVNKLINKLICGGTFGQV